MKPRSKLRLAAVAFAAALLTSCVVTAPFKVVKTGAKAGVAAGKAGVKTVKTAAGAVTPGGKDSD